MVKKSGSDTLAVLKSDLAENKLDRLYLFYGEEAYLKGYYLNEIKKKIVLPDESNLFVFSGKNLSPQDLYDAVTSFSLAAERKLVVVSDFDILCPDSKQLTVAQALINELPDSTCLVFIYGEGAPGEGRVNKKIEAAVEKQAKSIEFKQPGEAEYLRWIARRFAALGKSCGQREAKKLAELCGGLMYTAVPEIEKIAAFAQGSAISEKDIDDMASPLTETIIYKMTNAISAGSPAEAAELFGRLTEQGVDSKAAVMEIGRAVRRLYAAKLVADGGGSTREYMEASKIRSSYAADINMRQARRFRLDTLRKSVILCNEAEQRLLHARINEEVVLESLIYELCSEQNG